MNSSFGELTHEQRTSHWMHSFIQNLDRVRLSYFFVLSLSLCSSVPLQNSTQTNKTIWHITKHSTYDALWRIKATPNKTMEPNQIERNRCGYCAIHVPHTCTQHAQNETQQHYPSKSSFCVKVFDPWPFWSVCVYVWFVCLCACACRSNFFSFVRTKLQYEKSAFFHSLSVFHFKFANGTSDKNKACNQTPGRISIAIALQNEPNEKNSKRQTRTPITIPTLASGNNVPNIFHSTDRLRWRVRGDGAAESSVSAATCMWSIDLMSYQLKQFSMPKTLPFFFFCESQHKHTHAFAMHERTHRIKDKAIEHHIYIELDYHYKMRKFYNNQ